jgi:glutaredoxin
LDRFERVNTQVLGISVDSSDCLRAWAESLGGITYPLLSDFWPHGGVAIKYGVLRPEGKSERAIFIINKVGQICYVDVHDIDEQPDNEILFGELAALEGVPIPQEIIKPAPVEPVVPEMPVEAQEPLLTMYCTDWCPSCRRARIYLKTNQIPYREVNISRDRQAAAEVRTWTGGYETTPTFNIQGTIVVNFDIEKLNELLGIQG